MPDLLTRRNGTQHFVRRVPAAFAHRDPRGVIRHSTKIRVASDRTGRRAALVASQLNEQLELTWRGMNGGRLDNGETRYDRARRHAQALGFEYLESGYLLHLPLEAQLARLEALGREGVARNPDARAALLGTEKRPVFKLSRHFGKQGSWFHGIARGEDPRPVRPDRQRKSSGSETTFAHNLTDLAKIEAGIVSQADEVWEWCQKKSAFGRTVTVKVKQADFEQITRSRSVPRVVDDQAMLRQISKELVRSVFPLRTGIRLLGVTVSNFNTPVSINGQLPF